MSTRSGLIDILRKDLAELLAAEAVPHSAACAITERLIERVRLQYGGDSVFIPAIDRAKRDAEIMAAWRAGQNIVEIAVCQGVARSTVYRIVNRTRSKRKASVSAADDFSRPGWNL